jgi:hypothetical protein
MKNILLLLVILFSWHKLHAQPPLYTDLFTLYVGSDYKKLVDKAQKYTIKPETKNDAIPYVYLSKALFKISQQKNRESRFKDSYEQSISYLVKCIEKDITHEVHDKEEEFYLEMKETLIDHVVEEFKDKSYKDAFSFNTKLKSLFPEDIAIILMDGALKKYTKDQPGAMIVWNENQNSLERLTQIDRYTEKEKEFLKLSVIQTIEGLKSIKQAERARNIGLKANTWFAQDDDFKKVFDTVK